MAAGSSTTSTTTNLKPFQKKKFKRQALKMDRLYSSPRSQLQLSEYTINQGMNTTSSYPNLHNSSSLHSNNRVVTRVVYSTIISAITLSLRRLKFELFENVLQNQGYCYYLFGKGEPKEVEPPKSIKLRVASRTKVRKFVAKALKKAALESPLVECVDLQYSSKKFGGKFLSVSFEQQVKDGREYKIWIREVVPLIKDEVSSQCRKFPSSRGDDLITCKNYQEIDPIRHSGLLTSLLRILENRISVLPQALKSLLWVKPRTVSRRQKEMDAVKMEHVSVPVEQVIVSVKSEQDSLKATRSAPPRSRL
uniref:Uncharacterized protein n=1 Tax=Ditylenchus dipsaci TaxID=166011 RepID=A0A915EG77_9BILA